MKDLIGKKIEIILTCSTVIGVIKEFDSEVGVTVVDADDPDKYVFCSNFLKMDQKQINLITNSLQEGLIRKSELVEHRVINEFFLSAITAEDCIFNQ